MKWMKTFEAFLYPESSTGKGGIYYTKINKSEYLKYIGEEMIDYFSEQEKKEIKKKIKLNVSFAETYVSDPYLKSILVINLSKNIRLLVRKTKDEWFIVESFNIPVVYYKCDQLDGLIKLLNDLKTINKSRL